MDEVVDVIQIGYGPVGQTSAALLANAGRSVLVLERHHKLYGLPRAGHIDHETMRTFQKLGVATRIAEQATPAGPYVFLNKKGEELIRLDWGARGISDWNSDYWIHQPDIEDALDDAVRSFDEIELKHGWEVVDIDERSDHVAVTARTRDGSKVQTYRGRFVIATDGGGSFTRSHLGIAMDDFGFEENWLVIDYRPTRPHETEFESVQICDPARPHNRLHLGSSHRRFAFMVLPGEDPAEMAAAKTAWNLIAQYDVTPDNSELVRNTVYKFESKLAQSWSRGRVFLAGDAAHVMPPFLGQGLCSGIRDVVNLSWKIGEVLDGAAPSSLLDTYETERRPHAEGLIFGSIDAGRLLVTIDPKLAEKRDEMYRSGQAQPPRPFPKLGPGLLYRSESPGNADSLVGTLAPQGAISVGAETGRFDDLLGTGWTLLLSADAPLTEIDRQELCDRGVRIFRIGADFGDDQEIYSQYFQGHGLIGLIYRPDFYVYAAATNAAELVSEISSMAYASREA
jgi:2-polyprenyl-6-methoxyphenol hydroxylase-like FAD-dependent oxidoreductase